MMSLTKESMILSNAPPIMTPTARSTMLPRTANSPNSIRKLDHLLKFAHQKLQINYLITLSYIVGSEITLSIFALQIIKGMPIWHFLCFLTYGYQITCSQTL